MDKLKAKYIGTLGLLISFLVVFVTGLIKFPNLLASLGVNVKNLPFREISKVHDWAGIIMGILVFMHLVQSWSWLVGMTKQYFGKK